MPQTSGQPALIRPIFHHFGVPTLHLDEMLSWYAKVLGITTVQSSRGLAFLSNYRAPHRMAVLALPAKPDNLATYPHVKFQYVAFEYETIDDLLTSWELLKGLGIEPVFAADHGPTITFYYQDPDGNSIELFIDTFGDWDKSREYMRTVPEFHRNPMGTFTNPKQMMAARKASATEAEPH